MLCRILQLFLGYSWSSRFAVVLFGSRNEKSRPVGRLGRTSNDARLTNNDDRDAGGGCSVGVHGLQSHNQMAVWQPAASHFVDELWITLVGQPSDCGNTCAQACG